MSHWTKVKTQMRSKELIQKALTRMDLKSQLGDFTVTEYGTSSKAQILLDKSLGLSEQEDGTYAFVGDPYHCTTQRLSNYYQKMDQLSDKLAQNYAVEEAIENLEQHQFFCTDNAEATVDADGTITMTFESYS